MSSITNFLRSTLTPHDVKVLTVTHEPERTGSNLRSDGNSSWVDIPALAADILRDMSRLPGYDRAL